MIENKGLWMKLPNTFERLSTTGGEPRIFEFH